MNRYNDKYPVHHNGRFCASLPRFAGGLCALVLAGGFLPLLAQSAAPAPEEKKSPWEITAAAGVTLTRGNSDTVLGTANILGVGKWQRDELRLGADGAYGENDDVKNAESLHGFAQYNRLFNERAFGYLRFDALHDAIADLEYRLTFSPGVGYYFLKNPTTSLSGEVGPGLVYEKQGAGTHTYLSLRVAERFEHKFSKTAKLWQSLEWLPQVDRFSNYILNAELGVETALTQKLALRVFAQDTYDNEPAPGRQKNDLKLVTAIAYKFQ
jgi:putative salt-induced outer membrane protein YdiY